MIFINKKKPKVDIIENFQLYDDGWRIVDLSYDGQIIESRAEIKKSIEASTQKSGSNVADVSTVSVDEIVIGKWGFPDRYIEFFPEHTFAMTGRERSNEYTWVVENDAVKMTFDGEEIMAARLEGDKLRFSEVGSSEEFVFSRLEDEKWTPSPPVSG